MRRSLGFKLRRHDVEMGQLIAFMKERKARRITTKLALDFATRDLGNGPKPRKAQLALVRGFAKYQAGLDPLTEIPPPGLLPSAARRAKPYLYSEDEIRILTQAALNRPSIVSLQPWTYYCVFGLLAVTGMRVSEVLNLRCEHIDWAAGILTVHETKFLKTALVPSCTVPRSPCSQTMRGVGRNTWRNTGTSSPGHPLLRVEVGTPGSEREP